MFIQRFVLVVGITAAAAALHAQTLVTNGGLEPARPLVGDGSMPPNEIRGWAAAYGTPRVRPEGCGSPGAVALSGNDAIRQPVALFAGVRYEVSLCARARPDPAANAHVVLRLSTTPPGDAACPKGTCDSAVAAKSVTAAWRTYRLEFTPSRDFVYLTLSTAGDGGAVPPVEIDDVSIVLPQRAPGEPAPLINANARGAIPLQYIVLFREGTTEQDAKLLEKLADDRGTVLFRYESDNRGFAVRLNKSSEDGDLKQLRGDPHVLWVEKDQRIHSSYVTQTVQARGIDRIDRRLGPLNGTYQYTYTGQGVHAYVFDTGVSPHQEFGSRLATSNVFPSGGTADCNGHGTHVAGILGGTQHGVAKDVTIHPVRVLDCDGTGQESAVIAGVDWLTANRILPAVANLSLSGRGPLASLDLKVTNSIASGIPYVVAADNRAADACNFSPARISDAITVGAVNPITDVRHILSNHGPCVDLFAPGTAILSAWHTSTTATTLKTGTSMAAPHVAGVAALYLQTNPFATPADVWSRIHDNANVCSTPNWQGVGNAGPGSPNKLLHWGPLSDGYDDGDPHLTTVDGTHYDFQSAGEFVLLRGAGVEIQTRQTPVPTSSDPPPDPYDGLATCVSVNTAVAARVGPHRVTYQPNLSGVPDPTGMQLRIDGNLVTPGPQGIDLPGGGRVVTTAVGGGLEIHFPDDTVLTALPGWWSSQQKWFLNVHVHRTSATEGIMGRIAGGSWLPALPDGTSLGPMPPSLQQRFVDLYRTFADAWRVTQTSSLFDYAPGTSTQTFTDPAWPPEHPPCTSRGQKAAAPAARGTAEKACSGVRGEEARRDCIFDVSVTGASEFAALYRLSEQLRRGATSTVVGAHSSVSVAGEKATFTAIVRLLGPGVIPRGSVQFLVDGSKSGDPVPLDDSGRASWTTVELTAGSHRISARYSPAPGSEFLPSSSADRFHVVRKRLSEENNTIPRKD